MVMEKYNCIIVEDEPLAAEVLEDYIRQVPFLNLKGICPDAIFAMEVLQEQNVQKIFGGTFHSFSNYVLRKYGNMLNIPSNFSIIDTEDAADTIDLIRSELKLKDKNAFPKNGWELKDGVLKVLASDGAESENGGDIVTEAMYGAFDLQFEFRLTEGANSGVIYFVTESEGNKGSAIGLEYQILDDEKHPDAKLGRDGNRTLSGLYDLITPRPLLQSLKRKMGLWNQGVIRVYPDKRVEHWLNGAKVVEYQRGSDLFLQLVKASKYKDWPNFGMAEEGRILLQDHGDAVAFRSIKIRRL
jgi:hypothetical protein